MAMQSDVKALYSHTAPICLGVAIRKYKDEICYGRYIDLASSTNIVGLGWGRMNCRGQILTDAVNFIIFGR